MENSGKNLSQSWILCPLCNSKTRVKINEDTELKNFPLFCPKCKKETLIEVTQLKTRVIKEPDARRRADNSPNHEAENGKNS